MPESNKSLFLRQLLNFLLKPSITRLILSRDMDLLLKWMKNGVVLKILTCLIRIKILQALFLKISVISVFQCIVTEYNRILRRIREA